MRCAARSDFSGSGSSRIAWSRTGTSVARVRVSADAGGDELIEPLLVAQPPQRLGGLKSNGRVRVAQHGKQDTRAGRLAEQSKHQRCIAARALDRVDAGLLQVAALAEIAEAVQCELGGDANRGISVIAEHEQLLVRLAESQLADGKGSGETDDGAATHRLVDHGVDPIWPSGSNVRLRTVREPAHDTTVATQRARHGTQR